MTTESPELTSLLQSLMHPKLKAIDLSLQRMERHLDAIGNPQRQLPPVVHVAGTNGKGSTIAFLRAILEASGYRCHVFTSPHLVHFRERLVVAGKMLDEPALIDRFMHIKQRSEEYPLTFFEANTVAAFELFAESEADVTLLEVGMGGRFDATNVIEHPALSIITPVSMDHQEFLGDTLAKIAFEKAGILKPNTDAISAPQAPEAKAVIEEVAKDKGAQLHWPQMHIHTKLGLSGEHQQMNASVAAESARRLKQHGFAAISDDTIDQGLSHAHWPGRLQRLTQGPLVDALPANAQLWLDGGHNASAGRQLAKWLTKQEKPATLMVAMSGQRDPTEFLAPFNGVIEQLIVMDIPHEPLSIPLETLAISARALGMPVIEAPSPQAAVQALPSRTIGLMCGSLYLVGYVLQKNS